MCAFVSSFHLPRPCNATSGSNLCKSTFTFFASPSAKSRAATFPNGLTMNAFEPPSASSATATANETGLDVAPLAVMVNGLPGKMAAATAEEVLRRGLVLAEEAMTGAGMADEMTVSCDDSSQNQRNANVRLRPPSEHGAALKRMRDKYDRVIVVDYTHPSAANANVELYAAEGMSFVIGTTGGDADKMKAAVAASPFSDMYAVIAPNMGKQIVAFQAMMKMMSEQFPGVFSGYKLSVTESHQSTKADTSGTAKAVVNSLCDMGVDPFTYDDIQKVRSKQESIDKMGVPEQFVDSGHAYHTYHLSSADNTVHFEFQHNVCGRAVYAAGTVDAVQFLDARKRQGVEEGGQRVFSMIDILQSGSMS